MKILIIGGLGYVGGRLTNHLADKCGRANLAVSSRRERIPEWASQLKVYSMDLTDQASISDALNDFKPDTIIHLGAMDQRSCQENPDQAYAVNVGGTQTLCNAALNAGVKNFLYFSTFQVYGDLSGDITEDSTVKPEVNKVYPITKFAAEEIVRQSGLNFLIFRLSNAYGYSMDCDVAPSVWSLVFNAFALCCLRDGKIAPRDNAYRDFIAMEDVCRAVSFCLFDAKDKWSDSVFNLGGENLLSVTEVAEKVAQIYQILYKKEITILYPKMSMYNSFCYRINSLKNIGFELKSNMRQEIEQVFKRIEQEGLKL